MSVYRLSYGLVGERKTSTFIIIPTDIGREMVEKCSSYFSPVPYKNTGRTMLNLRLHQFRSRFYPKKHIDINYPNLTRLRLKSISIFCHNMIHIGHLGFANTLLTSIISHRWFENIDIFTLSSSNNTYL